eukprot:14997661-Alexandrium_andersonii.AAC.1
MRVDLGQELRRDPGPVAHREGLGPRRLGHLDVLIQAGQESRLRELGLLLDPPDQALDHAFGGLGRGRGLGGADDHHGGRER